MPDARPDLSLLADNLDHPSLHHRDDALDPWSQIDTTMRLWY
jgi:hypothetical protein